VPSDSVNIGARFPRQLVQAIEQRAEIEERSLSGILRRAASLYVADVRDPKPNTRPERTAAA
jgi:hypothetical protein